MRSRLKPLPSLGDEQASAADPQVHAALSASAGTGKTQVLTARVLRLLLQGVRPETILCLTFTKAGASEMVNRIGARLAAWVRMKDSQLGAELLALGEDNGPVLRDHARRLFARVLDAPGGLRIQTVHSFAQTLLAAFPAEAGIVPGFQPIEGRAEQELVRRTLADLLARAEATGDEGLVGDVQCLSLRLGEGAAVDYLTLCAKRHEALAALGAPEAIEPMFRELLGVPEGSVETYLAEHCGDERFDCDLLRAIAEANRRWGTATGSGVADQVERWLSLDAEARASALPELALVVFTGKGELRKVSKGQLKTEPDYAVYAARLADALAELLRVQSAARLAWDMAAGLRAGQAFAEAYTRAKRSAGVADFNDLIHWTRRLLAQPGMGDWVRYKLDRQTDHILVDEAQDTNSAQWDIVKALAEEYFSGSTEAERRHRTIFMVGDFKQAIFRFQGTDPREFEAARVWARDNAEALIEAEATADAGERLAREFRDLSITASFRSTQPVLDVVDSAIREVGFSEMGLPDPPPPHRACEANRRKAGLVELWQPYSGGNGDDDDDDESVGEEGWLDEKDRAYADSLAKQVRRWIDEAPALASTKRPLTPGDILILVRSRGELASLLVARLFSAGVPVAGIDRLHLSKPFAVRDLLAAASFAVQPLDDLNLANLLVSPLVGWTQQQLFDLANDRKGRLWAQLKDRSKERQDFAAAVDMLGALLEIADYTTPYQFLETILTGPIDGRRKLYSRLGLAARDPIDELLSSALEFERSETASLDRFLAWFARGEVEVQRDPSAAANAVRVMTVHGAKGLEAPVVILADATADPKNLGRRNPPLDLPIGGASVPVIRPTRKEAVEPFATIIAGEEALDLEEHWRLLYVGLTRAIEHLVVAGVAKDREVEDCWHKRVERALVGLGAEWQEDSQWGRALRYDGGIAAAMPRPKPVRPLVAAPLIPEWARSPAPPEARPPRPLAPSSIAEDRESAPPPSAAMRAAAQRGTLIHQLLERLPAVEEVHRHQTAMSWMEQSAGVPDKDLRADVADTVCGVLADARFSALFGSNSLGEAPLTATLADGRVVAGTVDRLLVEANCVSVVDFKSGRVPESDSAIPASHRAQMEAYTEALRVIFPGREVRAALLYTGGPRLYDLGG